MGINNINDTLLLAKVKQHLQVDEDISEDDTLIQTYIDNSLAYVTNYTDKTFEVYNITEDFFEWVDDVIYLEWETEVRAAQIKYTDTSAAEQTINVMVYAENVIRELIPADYNGGNISVTFTPYIEQLQVCISHQARLLIIGDWYINRENTIIGASVAELNNFGANNILNSIKLGIM